MFQRLSLVLVSNIMMLYSVRPMRKLPGWTSGQVSSPPNRQPAHTTDLLSSAQLLQTINIPKTSVVDPDLKRLNDIFFACSTNMIVNIFFLTRQSKKEPESFLPGLILIRIETRKYGPGPDPYD